jgi:hypothetical protein
MQKIMTAHQKAWTGVWVKDSGACSVWQDADGEDDVEVRPRENAWR